MLQFEGVYQKNTTSFWNYYRVKGKKQAQWFKYF